MALIPVTDRVTLDESELDFTFVRASGPGGQNVNKVSTAVQLRFDLRNSPSIPGDIRMRMVRIAGRKLTDEGILVIDARRHRSQERNREEAVERLLEMIREASIVPKFRRPTRPTYASQQRRLAAKGQRSAVKRLRGSGAGEDA